MKKVLAFVILICMIFTSISVAQSNIDDYRKMDYISVDNGDIDAFLKIAENELKPIFQKLVDSEAIKSWVLYAAKHPGGEKSNYNLISITTADDLDRLDEQFGDIDVSHFIPSSASPKLAKSLKQYCTLVKSELWLVENLASERDTSNNPSQYLNMGFMNVAPGKSPDYLMLEEEIAKPIHEERINQNTMARWEVYSMITPGGTRYGYNFSTANYYNDISELEFGFTEEIINQTMGQNANISELFDTIYSTRELVKVELWELVTHTE